MTVARLFHHTCSWSRAVTRLASAVVPVALFLCMFLASAADTAAQGTITVAWDSNPEPDIGGYVIESGDSPGLYTSENDVGNKTSYTLSGFVPGETYYIVVRAYNQSGMQGPRSAEVSGVASHGAGVTPPPTSPSNLSAAPSPGNPTSAIDLSWNDNADNETGYSIERSTTDSNYLEIQQVGANQTAYPDVSLPSDTTYWYRVRTFGAGGNSAYTNSASARTDSLPANDPPPDDPPANDPPADDPPANYPPPDDPPANDPPADDPPAIDSSHRLAKGLRGLWLFNEGGGLSFRNLVDGSIATAENATATALWEVDATHGRGPLLDGTDDQIRVPNFFNPSTVGDFSWFIWVRFDTKAAGTDSQVILQQEGASGRTLLRRDMSSGDVDKLGSYLGGVETTSTTTPFSNTGEWHLVGLTYDGTTLESSPFLVETLHGS